MSDERMGLSLLRRWCPIYETYQDADDKQCAWVDHTHLLRLRRMIVCQTCQQAYFTRAEFNQHECGSAY